MDYFEIIVDANTGEQTVRPFSPDEIAEIEAAQAAAVSDERAAMSLTFVQLLIGLVSEGWITQVDGEAWLAGTLPAPVVALIQTLPQGQQFAATARATRPSVVMRTDPLLNMLADTQGKTPEQVDQFFRTYEVA